MYVADSQRSSTTSSGSCGCELRILKVTVVLPWHSCAEQFRLIKLAQPSFYRNSPQEPAFVQCTVKKCFVYAHDRPKCLALVRFHPDVPTGAILLSDVQCLNFEVCTNSKVCTFNIFGEHLNMSEVQKIMKTATSQSLARLRIVLFSDTVHIPPLSVSHALSFSCFSLYICI